MIRTQIAAVDFDRLLTPISADRPSGQYLRHEGTYDAIQEARRQDDELDQGPWVTDRKRADWGEVIRFCLDALYSRSKDVRIAAWLLDALIHEKGVGGSYEGLAAIHHICEAFWETLHPGTPNGDGLEARLSVFEWINQNVSLTLKLVPITSPESADAKPYTYAECERAMQLENASRRNPRASAKQVSAASAAMSQFLGSIALTPTQFFADLNGELEAAINECDSLGRYLDETLDKSSPGLTQFRQTLLDIYTWTSHILGQRDGDIGMPPSQAMENGEEINDPERVIQSAIRNRWEAYRMLTEAAEYLARTEPHSPVPYLVRRAVMWGNMKLDEVLTEVIRNDAERKEIFRLLQIPDRQ
jgi:type VI secretion system ImpA family protein